MDDLFIQAANGDKAAFTRIYESVYKQIYYVSYYSLANSKEAASAVIGALHSAYENISSCKSEEEFRFLLLKKTCDRIIAYYREYRKTPPEYEKNPTFIKARMIRLTDAERLAVTIWAVFGYEAEQISAVTGLSQDVLSRKLESGRAKLAEKL